MRDSNPTPVNISCQKNPFPSRSHVRTRPTRTPVIRHDGPETVEWVRMEPFPPLSAVRVPPTAQAAARCGKAIWVRCQRPAQTTKTYYAHAHVHIHIHLHYITYKTHPSTSKSMHVVPTDEARMNSSPPAPSPSASQAVRIGHCPCICRFSPERSPSAPFCRAPASQTYVRYMRFSWAVARPDV